MPYPDHLFLLKKYKCFLLKHDSQTERDAFNQSF